MKVYEYANCSTCKKAVKYLDLKKVKYERLPIVDTPPTPTELKKMLGYLKAQGHGLTKLFNTSGTQYRELGIAAKIKGGMSESEAITLLSKNGKLIKRPFLLTKESGTVGFNEEDWNRLV